MKCKGKFINLFTALLLGFVALNLSFTAMDYAVENSERKAQIWSCFPTSEPSMPSDIVKNSLNVQSSEPIVYLFRILFIFFIISPPLIVLMLFLIWKELRERNKMK